MEQIATLKKMQELDFETLVRMCLDKRDPDGDECAAAAEKSGLSYEDFRAKIVAKLEGDKPKTEPKHEEPKPEEPKAEPTKKVEPVVVKKTEPTKKPDDFGTAFEKCLAMRNFDSDECIRAEELSGLSTADFEAKFKAKLAAKDGSDFWTVFEKCLMTRDWRSDLCFRFCSRSGVQSIISYTDAAIPRKPASMIRRASTLLDSRPATIIATIVPTPRGAIKMPAVWTG